MAKIFLSHSSNDKKDVRKLAEMLLNSGIEVWLDEWEIFVGDPIIQKVESGIENADFMAVWITKSALESGWVQKEWQSKFHDEINTGTVKILPLLAEDVKVPKLLRNKLFADFRGEFDRGFDQLMAVPGVLNDINSSQVAKLLVILAGPSGVGKDVIQNRLYLRLQSDGYFAHNLQKYTTRIRRPEESQQSNYFHLTHTQFDNLLEEGAISCDHDSFGNRYGVDSNFCKHASPSSIIIYNVRDLHSLSDITRQASKKGLEVVKILLTADLDSLLDRINLRSASAEEKTTRSETARSDIKIIETKKDSIQEDFDLEIENSDNCRLREVLDNIYCFIDKHALKKASCVEEF